MPQHSTEDLRKICTDVRRDVLNMIYRAGSGHPGGSLSAVELLTSLFFSFIKRSPENVDNPDRHRFILSKGHATPTLYTLLAYLGIIPRELLQDFRKLGSPLQGHPDRIRLPAVEASTGSLGQGLSIAQGLALGLRLRKSPASIFCLLGDGEIQEGQVWESFMSAPQFKLNKLVAIIDCNGGQLDGHTKDIMNIESMKDKLNAFNWNTIEIDGHDLDAVHGAYSQATSEKNKAPSCIIARTIKGKGISFMENNIAFHGKSPTPEEFKIAISELENP